MHLYILPTPANTVDIVLSQKTCAKTNAVYYIYGRYSEYNGTFTDISCNFYEGTPFYYVIGQFVDTSVNVKVGKSVTAFSVDCYLPVYEIVPLESMLPELNSIYDITTRPTTITGGNYGIVGDNGQITKIEDNRTIINETNNTYYNPATGKTETINNWSYDYSDRSYNVTLETGDTITVTYGDKNITIIEGDTTYNIYYIIDGSGSGSGSGGNIFSGIFVLIWDFFSFFTNFFSDFVVGGIKGLIKALLDSASDIFSIPNPFDWGY